MLFNSYEYLFLFLPAVFALYFSLQRLKKGLLAQVWLVVASLFFYAYWKTKHLPLLLFSVLVNYIIGRFLVSCTRKNRKKALLASGIVFNLGLLAWFKYAGFIVENLNAVSGLELSVPRVLLPLAISFFTFQQIAYLVDAYRNQTRSYGFLNYLLFVTFFPQLVAGPIVHHKEMMPQFADEANRRLRYDNLAAGLFLFSVGLFKKVILADTFAVWVEAGFRASADLTLVEAWFTSLAYTLELYFDFSGYTDMALGAALLFNIRLPINFYSPYKAVNIREFWHRWHMTLSRFLRDYLYIPLGGNRKGKLATYRNLFLVFLLGGIWHGAGWTFAAWGALHGVAMIVLRLWGSLGVALPAWLAWFLTFNFVNASWVFFRADSFDQALEVLEAMFAGPVVLPAALEKALGFLSGYGVEFGSYLHHVGAGATGVLWLAGGTLLILAAKNSVQLSLQASPNRLKMLFASALFAVSVLHMDRISEFIYFNF